MLKDALDFISKVLRTSIYITLGILIGIGFTIYTLYESSKSIFEDRPNNHRRKTKY